MTTLIVVGGLLGLAGLIALFGGERSGWSKLLETLAEMQDRRQSTLFRIKELEFKKTELELKMLESPMNLGDRVPIKAETVGSNFKLNAQQAGDAGLTEKKAV